MSKRKEIVKKEGVYNMKNNEELQILLDSIVQTLSEIREEIAIIKDSVTPDNKSDNGNPLSIDLLNKIAETIEHAKKAIDKEELKKFLNVVISVSMELQERANKASAEFLNQKITELNELTKQPSIIENRYSIDFKSSRMFTFLVISIILFITSGVVNYNLYQSKNKHRDNDLKYRYVKMVQGVDANTLFHLERIFNSPDSAHIVKNIRINVTDYEQRLKEKIQKEEQKKRLEKEIESLNIK